MPEYKVGFGHLSYESLLFAVYGFKSEAVEGAFSGFYLNKNETAAIHGDDIDLVSVKAPVSFQYSVSLAFQIFSGSIF